MTATRVFRAIFASTGVIGTAADGSISVAKEVIEVPLRCTVLDDFEGAATESRTGRPSRGACLIGFLSCGCW